MPDERIRGLVTPPIYTSGVYALYQPFSIPLTMIYRCYAVRSFDELAARDIDVYEEYYKPLDLSEKIYEEDQAAGASIVTLISVEEEYYYVPNTYIESYPGMAGLRYDRKLIILDIGPLPTTIGVDNLIDDLQDLVTKVVGVTEERAKVKLTTITMSTPVTHEEHIQLEATRRAAIRLHTPVAVQLAEQTARANKAEEQNAQLLEIISQHPELFDVSE